MNVILFILIVVYVVYTQYTIYKLKWLLNIAKNCIDSISEAAVEMIKEIENGEMEEDTKQ